MPSFYIIDCRTVVDFCKYVSRLSLPPLCSPVSTNTAPSTPSGHLSHCHIDPDTDPEQLMHLLESADSALLPMERSGHVHFCVMGSGTVGS